MTQNEMNWSLGTYMTNEQIEKIFGVTDLPRPWGVAPNQPFTGRFYYTWGLLPLLAVARGRDLYDPDSRDDQRRF